jgi:hypothetical protein
MGTMPYRENEKKTNNIFHEGLKPFQIQESAVEKASYYTHFKALQMDIDPEGGRFFTWRKLAPFAAAAAVLLALGLWVHDISPVSVIKVSSKIVTENRAGTNELSGNVVGISKQNIEQINDAIQEFNTRMVVLIDDSSSRVYNNDTTENSSIDIQKVKTEIQDLKYTIMSLLSIRDSLNTSTPDLPVVDR